MFGRLRSHAVILVLAVLLVLVAVSQSGCASGSANLAGDIADEPPATETSNSTTSTGSFADIPREAQEAVKKGPAIQLHSKETYWPMSIDAYLERCVVHTNSGEVAASRKALVDAVNKGLTYGGNGLKLIVNDSDWQSRGSVKAGEPGKAPWPTYIAIAKVTVTQPGKEREYLVAKYNTFYGYNSLSASTGDQHWGDWEGAIQVWSRPIGSSAPWGDPRELWTKTHNYDWDLVESPDKYPTAEGGRLKAYAALNSHGTWDHSGQKPMADQVNSTGIPWNAGGPESEIVEYVELEYDHEPVLGDLLLWKNAKTKNLVYQAKWFLFAGPWGQSVESGDIGNSPWSSMIGFAH